MWSSNKQLEYLCTRDYWRAIGGCSDFFISSVGLKFWALGETKLWLSFALFEIHEDKFLCMETYYPTNTKGLLRRQFANVPVISLCRGRKACVKTWVVNVIAFVHLVLKNHYGSAWVPMSILWLFQCPVIIGTCSRALGQQLSCICFNEGDLFHICL